MAHLISLRKPLPEKVYRAKQLIKDCNKKKRIFSYRTGKKTGKDIKVENDSTAYADVKTKEPHKILTSEIRKIKYNDHLLGELERFGFDIVGSGLILVATADGSTAKGPGGTIPLLIGLGAMPVAGIGLGAGIGHTYEYNFMSDSTIIH